MTLGARATRAVVGVLGIALCLALSPRSAEASPVDLELLLAADVSGSIDDTDFALQRAGFEAAFRSPSLIAAIEGGLIGSIAVALWDFANDVAVAVDWFLISDATSANAFADLIAAAPRSTGIGFNDGQSNLINQALTSLNTNGFEGTRRVLDIASEGAEDVAPCTGTLNCPPVQTARDAFLAGGGSAINAIWLNDRDFFGLDPTDAVNAFAYGSLNVIGGAGSFQVFANDFTAFGPAIEAKITREVSPVPEPATLLLFGAAAAAAGVRRRFKRAA